MTTPGTPNNQRQSLRKNRLLVIHLFFAFAIGTSLLLSIWGAAQRIYRLTSWIPVDAIAVDTEITKRRDFSRTRGGTDYSVNWIFNYEVGSRKVQSATDPGYSTSVESRMKTWQSQFRRGQTYKLHYDPNNIDSISVDQWNYDTFWYPAWLLGWSIIMTLLYLFLRKILSKTGKLQKS